MGMAAKGRGLESRGGRGGRGGDGKGGGGREQRRQRLEEIQGRVRRDGRSGLMVVVAERERSLTLYSKYDHV